ncbi:MAG: hypothetical protein DWQ19_10285 [Crenarchaeota archaeon]|nr:MAG: hypothetical protein DWQ19_10285 [Thermoproteota archaeon]
MKWFKFFKKKKPIVRSLYWCKQPRGDGWHYCILQSDRNRVLEIFKVVNGKFRFNDTYHDTSHFPNSWWYGPIEVPSPFYPPSRELNAS